MTAPARKAIDAAFFDGFTDAFNGFISDSKKPEFKKISDDFEKKNIMYWPKTITEPKSLIEQMKRIKNVAPFVAGAAEEGYQMVLKELIGLNYDVSDLSRPVVQGALVSSKEALGDDLKLVDGKVRPVVDVIKFRAEMKDLTSTLKRLEIIQAITKNSAEQNFWALIVDMLQYDESFELIGILAARLLMPPEQRASLDSKLVKITVLQNKQGKLSIGVVRLGGFMGLAAAQGEPKLAQAVKFVQNPLLGEDVKDRPMNKKKDESQEAYNNRKAAHEGQFASYKAIMTEMKDHAKDFNKLPEPTKAKIKAAVLSYTVYAD